MTVPNKQPPLSPKAVAREKLSQLAAESLKLSHSNNGLREGFTTFPIALRGSASTTRSCLGTL